MSTEFPSSSNPFRRKGGPTAVTTALTPHANDDPSIPASNHVAYQQMASPLEYASFQQVDAPKKVTKKVRVQSPPPPSPSMADSSSSTIGDETYSISIKPPTPIPRDDDPFENTNYTSEDEEEEEVRKPTQAPANPFSKTLETMEHPGREGAGISPTNVSAPGRASMDVEAFKRLLMTGSSGLGISTPPTALPAQAAHGLGDGGSSTDTSSVSRQSIFDAIQETHPAETPRTSHEISEPEDDRRVVGTDFTSMTAGRKKPPPPSSRHGKLIKVELRDDPAVISVQSPITPGSITSITSQAYFSSSPHSQTDLNKPLPPAPARSSHESDRESSIFDRESAGKTPDPPSPSTSIRKKTPPAPPLARRHSQLVSDSKLTRSDSGRLSPRVEEDTASIRSVETNRSRSDSYRAPPPPPSRRPASLRNVSQNQLTSPMSTSTTFLPAPPPTRGLSRSGRSPSINNAETVSSTPNKRLSTLPPPPPPPRHGRTSIDGTSNSPGASQRPSGEIPRRSIDSARRGSTASSLSQVEIARPNPNPHDVLADLNALQREIDALRGNSVKENVA